MISIIDYGMGNLGSILNMFKYLKIDAEITGDLEKISKAEKLLLPGVGAFDAAMSRINDSGIRQVLDKKVLEEKTPVLGICLGMQLLTNSSEEGKIPGLGWIEAKTQKFSFNSGELKVPHIGWNKVIRTQPSKLTENFDDEFRFYFVHSYYVLCNKEENVILTTQYGLPFHSAIHRDNIYGTQFHPEKSHKFGMQLLKNFAGI
jgi:imidazole glycerol-phosphate synthase subunit HisH